MSISNWFFPKHKAKAAKQAITPVIVNHNIEEVITCILQAVTTVGLIRKPEPELTSPIHNGKIAANKGGNFTAVLLRGVILEVALGVVVEIHKKYQLGATDEGQCVSVVLHDDMLDIMKVLNKSIGEGYSKLKTTDAYAMAKGKFDLWLNNEVRFALREYFKDNKRLIDAVSHYKAVNSISSVNVTDDTIKNFMARKGMKQPMRTYEELVNDLPPDSLYKPAPETVDDVSEVVDEEQESILEILGKE